MKKEAARIEQLYREVTEKMEYEILHHVSENFKSLAKEKVIKDHDEQNPELVLL